MPDEKFKSHLNDQTYQEKHWDPFNNRKSLLNEFDQIDYEQMLNASTSLFIDHE